MKFCKTPKNAFSGFIIPRNIENCKMCDPVHGIKLEIYVKVFFLIPKHRKMHFIVSERPEKLTFSVFVHFWGSVIQKLSFSMVYVPQKMHFSVFPKR